MCAELAAFELKEIFLKIHYFGRKINFKRKQKKEQMEVRMGGIRGNDSLRWKSKNY